MKKQPISTALIHDDYLQNMLSLRSGSRSQSYPWKENVSSYSFFASLRHLSLPDTHLVGDVFRTVCVYQRVERLFPLCHGGADVGDHHSPAVARERVFQQSGGVRGGAEWLGQRSGANVE